MADEPDLSMLHPTTVAYLRERADLFALHRLNPGHLYSTKGHIFDALRPLHVAAREAGDDPWSELARVHNFLWNMSRYAESLAYPYDERS
jgi:hypothetical protein